MQIDTKKGQLLNIFQFSNTLKSLLTILSGLTHEEFSLRR
ncbi:hypothetical protein pah_c249o009 [Parachlamydia acanthamoebae str. Hall's coccus]|nr:hypothetical protein pah_c249o009 [Parachlamydia acanthamoebae str. Hall's coccus]